MAFPLPSHLPRQKDPQDVSTKILTKISEATAKSLNAELASSWVAELDDTITQTKERIYERISHDLPAFNEQLTSARSIQERLGVLTTNVDSLSSHLSDSESGLVPRLLGVLSRHAALAQASLDAETKWSALSHLLLCKNSYHELARFSQEGRLPEAMEVCQKFEADLSSAPRPLERSSVMGDLQRSFRVLKARTEEQLDDAYTRGVKVSPSEVFISTSVQVRQSDTSIFLSSVLAALPQATLTSHLASLRRDLITHYVDFTLKQPASVVISSTNSISGASEHRLNLYPAPPNSTNPSSRLENLSTILTFIDTHLLPHLPSTERASFSQSLCKPLRLAVLNHLLAPSLPSSLDDLPDFLHLVQKARQFETDYIQSALGDTGEAEIKVWSDNVDVHYERKRRTELLETGRHIVLAAEDESQRFFVGVPAIPGRESKLNDRPDTEKPAAEAAENEAETAWGFDDDGPSDSQNAPEVEEDAWGFGDDAEPETAAEPELQAEVPLESMAASEDPDPGDAWGWNDDSETLNDDDLDDPWNDGWGDDSNAKPSHANGTNGANGNHVKAKPATRLEKLSSKGKNSHTKSLQAPAPAQLPPPTPFMSSPKEALSSPHLSQAVEESYMVSGRSKELVQHTERILSEGARLASSGIFSSQRSPTVPIASLLLQAAPFTLELYRAIYPVTCSKALMASPKLSIRFSNDCLYLSAEVGRLLDSLTPSTTSVKTRLEECRDHLKLLGESWFAETILVNETLDKAEGFVDTMEQDRFDECESALSQVLQRVRQLAQEWKGVLTKSKYYDAVGATAEAALSRVLADILALPDITADESHRLNELCHILNALEGLFVSDRTTFVVAYVPSWLKFSYLSELLEASIADISYLFEEGALVDFEVDELVNLVRALFADTPLRTTTINKLLRGHPIGPVQS
ncbi:uncharacterized protein FIBRA_04643 [Fibroporia radiculosa]|uniref:Uncharacterized protein n=1 Tax=Fibroporia radiculosa TaxID=599839 RepID=J4IA99_9APHY|nr:uncharacterized protein FIBRA_04643 [Fibroporia radiculosa]CCM02541.1 predicted protein [Fibroporia radiculosa]